MKSYVFSPDAAPPTLAFEIDEGGVTYEEVIELRLVYGSVEGSDRTQQIYVVDDADYFHPDLIDHIRQMEAESDVRIEPASRVEVVNEM